MTKRQPTALDLAAAAALRELLDNPVTSDPDLADYWTDDYWTAQAWLDGPDPATLEWNLDYVVSDDDDTDEYRAYGLEPGDNADAH